MSPFPFLFGVIVFAWGISMFLNVKLARKTSPALATFLFQLLGLPLLGLVLFAHSVPSVSFMTIIESLLLGFLIGVALILSMAALRDEKSVLVYSILESSLVMVFFFQVGVGIQTFSLSALLSILVVFTGVSLCSLTGGNRERFYSFRISRGMLFALLSAVLTALYYILLEGEVRSVGWLYPVLYIRIGAMMTAFVYFITNEKVYMRRLRNAPWRIGFGAATADVLGFSAFSVLLLSQHAWYVQLISTISTIIAVVMGALFFKERVTTYRIVGVTSIFAGIVLLHLVSW